MLNLLVPTEPHEVMDSVLQTALLTQKRFESYIESFALRPAIPDYVPIDMVSGLAWHVDEKADEDARRESHALFTKFAEANGLPAARPGVVEPGWGWYPKAPAGDAFLASHARIFDLIVLGRPVSGKAVPSMATLEAALFESGRPILIAPPTPPTSIGETVVIAWNGSSETARTVAYAGPFLRKAKKIYVLTIEGWTNQGPTGEQLAMSLRRNEVAAESLHVAPGRRTMGETILEETAAKGGDLLLKGAYTQSRLRQMIFGGATAHVLAAGDVPVLMAH